MNFQDRKEATAPSLVANLAADYAGRVVGLTILFHPDTRRIGHYCEWPLTGRAVTESIGRYHPLFESNRHESASESLAEPHISREALSFEYRDHRVVLEKIPGACPCAVQGRELSGRLQLEPTQLDRGVTLQLGHAVVLYLRIGPPRGAIADGPEADFGLLGGSAAMARLRQQVARAGATDLDVLVLGETGVGKELTAAGIHRASARAGAPLVTINMAAVPTQLAPALLFGSARGAYTGAARATPGYFQQAAGGTLFLDEVGATPAEIQPQMLRALQQREIQVVGGALEAVDVRIVAATDAELSGDGCDFNAALRHRLGSIEIQVPALREHAEDVGELLLHFITGEAASMGCAHLLPGVGRDELLIAQWAEVFQLFARYAWPGNIRELGNAARQVLVASEYGLCVPANLLARLNQAESGEGASREPSRRPATAVDLETFRAAYIDSGCEVAATARVLGMSRPAVYRRLDEMPDLRLAADVPRAEVEAALKTAGGDVRRAARELVVSYQGLKARLRLAGGEE
ncbi:sigma 54-interacting transcriptional regulator [Parahaliea mediterranea]|uniref:Sigma-54-dependent Fis family transcriptional regulator n=1 Tax=Parahaliea mediterranea TaxID=651086 RepID=A0A939IKY2_9GAMM|nr:sigma 54-interacting transcriptional regulator [Parahaliea mediterranea]MBN7795408.1 sigma-54-dependent Fis family transcriptional regulator [Parahaliea mediterranea]